jgi:hypothetical protein
MIGEDEFKSLPAKQQNCLLYKNQLTTFEKLDDIHELLEGYKFNQKIQYYWLGGLSAISLYCLKVASGISFVTIPLLASLILIY